MNNSSITLFTLCALLIEATVAWSSCNDALEQCRSEAGNNGSAIDAIDSSLFLLQRGAKMKKGLGADEPKVVSTRTRRWIKGTSFAQWDASLASGVDPWMIISLVVIVAVICFSVYITVGSLHASCRPFEDMINAWSMLLDWKLSTWSSLGLIFLFMALYGRGHCLIAPLLVGLPYTGAGYTRLDLIGLVCFIWCLPAAAVLGLYSLLGHFTRSKCCAWVLFGAFVCALFVVFAAYDSRDLLECIFCHDCASCTTEKDVYGLRLFTGLFILVVNAIFLITFLYVAPRACWKKQNSISQSFDVNDKGYNRSRVLAGAFLAIIINPLLFFFTTIFPNQLETLGSGNIHKYVSQPATGAEMPSAWMKTTNLRLSDDIVLKFFPDCFIFYALLEVFALISLLTVLMPGLQRFFGRRLLGEFSVGEIMSGCILVTATAFWVYYWFCEHSYNGGSTFINGSTQERLMRTWGQTAVFLMSLLMLPASKSSIWLKALGISWEKALWVHRWLGYATLACIICHFLSFWVVSLFKYHTFPHDAFAMQLYYPINGYSNVPSYSNFTISMMELVAYPAVFMIGIPAMKRRGAGTSWEWFKYLHFVFMALIPATLLHAASSIFFLIGGVAFWLFDAALRFAGVADLNTKLLAMEVSNADGGITKLTFNKTHSEPGQFAWIKVPAISEWEWHPFSLCSSPDDGHSEMCIKSMGPSTFTDKLFQLTSATLQEKAKPFKILVDGPHGIGFAPLLADHAGVLLIAGGIGITPMHSTFRALAQMAQRKTSDSSIRFVKLLWVAKSVNTFEILADSLDTCLSSSDKMSLELFATSSSDPSHAGDRVARTGGSGTHLSSELRKCLKLGRPNFDETMEQATVLLEEGDGECLVLACGPESMVTSAADAARSHTNMCFHDMLFRL